jgi:hypothetical protein
MKLYTKRIMLTISLLLSRCDASSYIQHGNQVVIEYTLDPETSVNVNKNLQDEYIDPYTNWEYYTNHSKEVLVKCLPQELIDIILAMKHNNTPTVLVVHNFPVDEVIPVTPQTGHCPSNKWLDSINGKGYVSEASILGICSILGCHPDHDENEKDGTYIHQIIPKDDAKSKGEISSYGSAIAFGPHTENVYDPKALKFFCLLGLRGDPKVNTNIILLDDILAYLQNHLPEGKTYEWFLEQMDKDYIQKTGPTFRENQKYIMAPILTLLPDGSRQLRFNTTNNRTEGTDEDTRFVATFIKDMLLSEDFQEKSFLNVNLKKGDLLLFNNWEVMHGRGSFELDKENWRWLQRCYFALDQE